MKQKYLLLILTVNALYLAGCTQTNTGVNSDNEILFTAPNQLPDATVGVPYSYSFCQPDRDNVNDLCGSSASPSTNPTDGNEPYHFQLDSGVGFPPFGLNLNLNGLLLGTPTVAGEREFSVCAVDLSSHQVCVLTKLNVLEGEVLEISNDTETTSLSVTIDSGSCTDTGVLIDEYGQLSTSEYYNGNVYRKVVGATASGTMNGSVETEITVYFNLGFPEMEFSCGSWTKVGYSGCYRDAGQPESS